MASDCTTFCSTNRDGDTILVDALDQCEHRDETKLDHAHRAGVPDVLAIEPHDAANGRDDLRQDVVKRGFSGAIASKQGYDLPPCDVGAHAA